MRRLFFALWPEPQTSRRLASAIASPLADAGIQGVAAPDLHLTLCFLGRTHPAMESVLVERAGALDAMGFELHLDTLEYWNDAQALVLTAPRVPGAAIDLATRLRALARECGCPPDLAPWRPHVTLARHVPSALAPQRGPALRLAAQQFCLAQSVLPSPGTITLPQAPRYRRLQAWPLAPPAV